MPEVIIKYKKPETLKILKGLAKYLDFKLSSSVKKENLFNDILIPGDSSIDVSEISKIFTGKNIDAKKLRAEAWQRKR